MTAGQALRREGRIGEDTASQMADIEGNARNLRWDGGPMASVVSSEGHLEFESAGGVLLSTGTGAPGSCTVPERPQALIPATPASFDFYIPCLGALIDIRSCEELTCLSFGQCLECPGAWQLS